MNSIQYYSYLQYKNRFSNFAKYEFESSLNANIRPSIHDILFGTGNNLLEFIRMNIVQGEAIRSEIPKV